MDTATYDELKVRHQSPCCQEEFSLRHPRYDVSATLRSLSEQLFDFTMHYHGHRAIYLCHGHPQPHLLQMSDLIERRTCTGRKAVAHRVQGGTLV